MQAANHHTTGITCTAIMPTCQLPDILDDIRGSLLRHPRSISPKYFYDEYGSSLFEQICATPEYYPTRIESKLLARYASEIIYKTRPAQIMELGSGYSVKTRHLFDACESMTNHCGYAPLDVCEEVLIDSASKLSLEYEWLNVHPLLGDYHGGLGNLPRSHDSRLFVFLGSTIGNFEPAHAMQFIQELSAIMAPDDHLLIGVDRVKDSAVLNAAYNDSQGITAKFNRNILRVLNKQLDANFNLDEFIHSALFNAEKKRIEMRLVANSNQDVWINDLNELIQFDKGDDILTEVSQKYTRNDIEEILQAATLSITKHYEDEDAYFSLILATK